MHNGGQKVAAASYFFSADLSLIYTVAGNRNLGSTRILVLIMQKVR